MEDDRGVQGGAAGKASVIVVIAGGGITATPRVCIQIRGRSEVAVVAAVI